MNEILIGTAITPVIAVAAAAYRLGGDRAKRNGNCSRQFVTREFCRLQHKNLDEALREIKANTAHIPEIKTWIDFQKGEG